MSAESNADLARWLHTATRGLPSTVRVGVSAEIEAHYADAFEDYLSQGKSAVEAHRLALADLGEAHLTAGALREMHFARRRYLLAGFSALAFNAFVVFVATLMSAWLMARLISLSVIDLFFLLPALYALASFDALLRRKCFYFESSRPLALIRVGLMVIFLPPIIPLTLLGPAASPSPLHDLLGAMLQITIFVGLAVTGIALILLGDSLLRLRDRLYGMRPALCFSAFLCGFGVVICAAALALNVSTDVRGLAMGIIIIAYPIFSTLLAVLFFRAALRRSRRPMQMA